jgi:hypothetical protein
MTRIGQMAFLFVGAVTLVGCGQQTPPATCASPVLLSGRAPVTASSGNNANAITDGDPQSLWNAGTFPPAWVEIDLGSDVVVHHITVIPEQTPAGNTEHRFTGTTAAGRTRILGTLAGPTSSGESFVLAVPADVGSGIRKVKIDTVATPRSWVAWREIQVYGCR